MSYIGSKRSSSLVSFDDGTIGSGVVFPAGHVIQTNYILSTSISDDATVNGTTRIGTVNVEFNRKLANSYFLIYIASLIYRPSTSGQSNLGYQIKVNGVVDSNTSIMVKDDNSWHKVGQFFKDTTTGSVNDTIKIESLYQNTVSTDNVFKQTTIIVYEVVS